MNYIKGIGIDLTKISRFTKIISKHENNFITKILHQKEIEQYKLLANAQARSKFLASRWAAKEALVKATGNKSILFHGVYYEKDENGKPFVKIDKDIHNFSSSKDPILVDKYKDILQMEEKKIHLSLSHEDDLLTAIVILEV